MIPARKRFLPGIIGVPASILWGVGLSHSLYRSPSASGRFTSQRILDKTAALLPSIPAFSPASAYAAQYVHLYKRKRAWEGVWIIECLDIKDRNLGEFVWEADTGRLLAVTCLDQPMPSTQTSFGPRLAIAIARDWLACLSPQKGVAVWQPIEAPHHSSQQWTLRLRSQGRTATVRMDDAGHLLLMHAL